jgi:hypothetical protein
VPFLHDRVAADNGSAAPVGREAAPEQQRQDDAQGAGGHQEIPTVLRLNPEVETSTAKVKTAPTTSREILTPRLIVPGLLNAGEHGRCQGCRYEAPIS